MQGKHHKYANKEISIIFKQIFDEKNVIRSMMQYGSDL